VTATDYRHQETAAAFLSERRFAYLADEPGLGKTRSVVLAADRLKIRRILVACPGAVRRVWEAEFELWQSIDRQIVVEEGRLSVPPGRYVTTVVSHAALSHPTSMAYLCAGAPYDLLVVDEAHEYRRFDAARTKLLFGAGGLAGLASRVWLVSGTPVINSAGDLYPLVYGALRSPIGWMDFCSHYCEMRPDTFSGVKPVGVRNTAELADGLRPHLLRRTIASLGIKLPPLTIERSVLPVNPVEVAQAMAGLEDWTPQRLVLALADTDELRDAAIARVRRALGIAKAPAAAAYIEWLLHLGEGPVVAFFQHTDVRKEVYARLHWVGRRVSWIDGTVTKIQLQAAQDWFRAGRLDVLLVQTQAGGQGLTLTRSHRGVMIELPWTSTAVEQAVKRIHRISQTVACAADILLAKDCWLDDVLAMVVERKRRAGDELLALLTSNA